MSESMSNTSTTSTTSNTLELEQLQNPVVGNACERHAHNAGEHNYHDPSDLGLTVCHGILREHGGWLETAGDLAGKGCLHVYLPMNMINMTNMADTTDMVNLEVNSER